MPKYVVEYLIEETRAVEVEAESEEQARGMVEDWTAFDEGKNPHADTDRSTDWSVNYEVTTVEKIDPPHNQQELNEIADAILKAVN